MLVCVLGMTACNEQGSGSEAAHKTDQILLPSAKNAAQQDEQDGAPQQEQHSTPQAVAEAPPQSSAPPPSMLEDKPQNLPSQKLMLAEYAFYNNRFREAADHYFDVASKADDPVILERSIELSLRAEDVDQALQTLAHWQTLEPDSIELIQYRLLLHIKKGNFDESAAALRDLAKRLERKEIKGLDLAMGLLEREASTEHIYKTLQSYTKLPDADSLGWYYEAMFAVRLGEFADVLSVIKRSEGKLEDREVTQKLALFHVKALARLGREDDALKVLNTLVVDAADVETKQSYARILSSLGQSDKALELLGEVYREQPGNVAVLLDMIGIQLDGDHYDEALKLIADLEKKPGHMDNALFFRGLVYEDRKEYAQAIKQYQKISASMRNSQRVRARIVYAMNKDKGLDATLAFLKQEQAAQQRDSAKVDVMLMESDLLREHKQYQASLNVLLEAGKLEPDNLSIFYSQALLFEKLGELEKSEQKLKQIIERDARHSSALNALGYMLAVHTSRLDEAYDYLNKAIKLDPDDPAIIDSIGWVYYRKGNMEKAEEYIRKAFDKIQDPEVASHLIEILAKTGRRDEAGKLLKDMLKEHPEDEMLLKVKELLRG